MMHLCKILPLSIVKETTAQRNSKKIRSLTNNHITGGKESWEVEPLVLATRQNILFHKKTKSIYGFLSQHPFKFKVTVWVKIMCSFSNLWNPIFSLKNILVRLGFSPSVPQFVKIGLLTPIARPFQDCYYQDVSSFLFLLTKFIIFSPLVRQDSGINIF